MIPELVGTQEMSLSLPLGVAGPLELQYGGMDGDAAGGPLRVELHWLKSFKEITNTEA